MFVLARLTVTLNWKNSAILQRIVALKKETYVLKGLLEIYFHFKAL